MTTPLAASDLPARARHDSGLSAFLITDIEGSTRLWEEHAAVMGDALEVHDRLLRASVESNGGTVIKTTGDGILAVFDASNTAIEAALAGQRALRDAAWGATGPLRVRMAIHAGTAESRDGDFFGPALNRSARILAIGHGGQVLLSAVAAVLSGDQLPAPVELRDLGTHRLRDLDRPEQVFQVVVPDLARDFPPLRSLSTRRSNLPVQLTSFVGRERELAEVESLLARHRLVTLIGTGGTGKTRLMLEAAAHLAPAFTDGAWLAELASLGDPAQIASEVARALGAPEVPGQPALSTVTAFLAEKDLLLLLDNAEHLVDGVAGIAETLLSAASRLRILTTSREALAVPGEAVLQIQSLSCPTIRGSRHAGVPPEPVDLEAMAATESVRLFTERASAVAPEFVLGRDNVAAIAEICTRLDGIPLAIELAAARVAAMSTEDIARRLGDRFRLLAGGRRTAVPRQQTLHALIDWSWDLLTEDDRRLLRRLSIFTGGWTVAAAAAIVGDGPAEMDHLALIDNLTRLVDRSLVIVERGPITRYRMLETIRQYAREKLIEAGEVAALGDRHFAVFAALVEAAEQELRGPAMGDWLDRLDADIENVNVALEWGLEAAPWKAVAMCAAFLAYVGVRVVSEDTDARIEAAVEIARARTVGRPDASPAEQALAACLIGLAGWLWSMSGRAEVGKRWAADALPLARASGDVQAVMRALGATAVSTIFTGGGIAVRALFEENADLAEQSGTWWILGMSAGFAGASVSTFDAEAGEALVARAVDAARRSGSPYVIGAVSMARGRTYRNAGRTQEAVDALGAAIARFTELGDERMTLAARSDLAHSFRRGGRLDEAEAIYRQTIPRWVYFGNRGAVANQLENVAFLAADRGRHERAARLLGAAAAIRDAANAPMAFDERPELDGYLERLRAALMASAFEAAWRAGSATAQAEAVAEALADA